MDAKVGAIVPARGGSKGIPGKNLADVGGKPLIWYALKLAAQVADEVFVTSDDSHILSVSNEILPTAFLLQRDPELAGDDVPLDPVLVDAARRMGSDLVVTLLPTCPFLRIEVLTAAIRRQSESPLVPVVAALAVHEVVWNGFERIGFRRNRQHAEPLKIESGAFSICSRQRLIDSGTRYYAVPELYLVSKLDGFDIDEPEDLYLARKYHGA